MKASTKIILLRDESIDNSQKFAAMSELEIPKNTPRKRTSTDAIRKGGESRKRACGTAKKRATHDDVSEDEAVARESFMYHQNAKRRTEEEKRFVERKPRQRVRRLSCDQECCNCRDKNRFRINGVCGSCGHRRCAECLIRQLETTDNRIGERTSSDGNMDKA